MPHISRFHVQFSFQTSFFQEDSSKESRGWLKPLIPRYSKNGKTRLDLLPQPVGNDTFDHLVITNIENGTKTRLTYGKITVTKIFGWNQEQGLM